MTKGFLVLLVGILTTLLLMLSSDLGLSALALGLLLIGCLVYLAITTEKVRRQLDDLYRLRAAYDHLDQQAKLIIRSDLELHRIQEELDRQLASLMSLHRLGQQLQVSLQPEEVFRKLETEVVTSSGFTNGLLGRCLDSDNLEWGSLIGVSPAMAERVRQHLVQSGLLKHILEHPAPTVLQAARTTDTAQRLLMELLEIPALVTAGIMPHSGPTGCLLLGMTRGSIANPKAEEELVAILANQLTIAVENSALYETSWGAQQILEHKVQERTRELGTANAQLMRVNQAKSDFVSAVSHELRTPLAAIKGYAALLVHGQFGPVAAPQAERIAKIERHADYLTQLINNLLDIARIESGRVTMEPHVILAKDFLASVEEMVHPQLEAKRLHYSLELDGVRDFVGDPQHLQRVFVNLLSNAVKYTPSGGSIRIRFQRTDQAILATVSDTGCGIAAEDLPKLFQEFYRADDPVNQEIRGTGLGLALAKRIIEAHRGHLTVASEQGHGSTFTITLPLPTERSES